MKAVALTFLLLLTLTPAYSVTPPKPGSTCPKQGITKTYKGKTFKCKKVKGKLVWSKGKVVKQAAPVPRPSETSSPSPSQSSSPSASSSPISSSSSSNYPKELESCTVGSPWVIGYDVRGSLVYLSCGPDSQLHPQNNAPEIDQRTGQPITPSDSNQSPAPTPTPTGPSSPITLDNLDPEWTSKIAYSNVLKFAGDQKAVKISSELLLSPTVTDRPYRLYVQGLEDVARALSPIFKDPSFSIVLFTELDSEWIDQTQRKLMGNYLNNPTEQLQSNRLKRSGCNIGGFYLPNIILFCVKKQSELETSRTASFSAAHAFPHEYFHLAQFTSKEVSSYPVLGTSPLSSKRFRSCWIDEGFATFHGFALGGSRIDDADKRRLATLKELTLPYDLRRNQNSGTIERLLLQNDPRLVINLYKEVEQSLENCPDTQLAYFLGELAGEALVATFGFEYLNQFHLASGQTGDWKTSFEKIFGIAVDDFYVKMTPYLASQAKKFP